MRKRFSHFAWIPSRTSTRSAMQQSCVFMKRHFRKHMMLFLASDNSRASRIQPVISVSVIEMLQWLSNTTQERTKIKQVALISIWRKISPEWLCLRLFGCVKSGWVNKIFGIPWTGMPTNLIVKFNYSRNLQPPLMLTGPLNLSRLISSVASENKDFPVLWSW